MVGLSSLNGASDAGQCTEQPSYERPMKAGINA